MRLRHVYEDDVRIGLDALLSAHQVFIGYNGKHYKSYSSVGQVFPCHVSMLCLVCLGCLPSSPGFLIIWVIYRSYR